jgi:thiol-disulfide isomerase/thioredoxin
MNPLLVAGLLVALVAVATVLGLLQRRLTGRAARSDGSTTVVVSDLQPGAAGGSAATLLQFSTEVCAPCVATKAVLGRIASESDGVTHIDVDVTHRPDLARRFELLQSPTTLLLDGAGVVRARIGGAPRVGDLRAELDRVLAGPTPASGGPA